MVNCSRKLGFTLVEVLVVVTIMGILSGIGVASLRSAVANSRIKDAGINVTAFMQRAANEATRLNEKLCVKVNNQSMKLYKGACSTEASKLGDPIDEMTLESSNKFITGSESNVKCSVLGSEEKKNPEESMTLTPKIGVSPIPSGCFLMRYGNTDRFAASIKSPTKFAMYYELTYNGGADGSWFEP
jgi:prepilin-type N-terminal cleavage/methylation domain-containing protein